MMLTTLLAIGLIIVGSGLVASGLMGSLGNDHMSAFHTLATRDETKSMADQRSDDPRKKRMVRLGLKLFAVGVVLLVVAAVLI